MSRTEGMDFEVDHHGNDAQVLVPPIRGIFPQDDEDDDDGVSSCERNLLIGGLKCCQCHFFVTFKLKETRRE